MTTSTHQANVSQVDDSPMVVQRKPIVRVEDRDSDGRPDVFTYDLNHDGQIDIEHRIADRKTFVTVQRSMPWEPPPSLTHYTGEPDEVSLRVTFKVRRIAELVFEINGCPTVTCPESYGMCSLGLLWDAEREHRDEVQAAQHFWCMNGGVGGFERA